MPTAQVLEVVDRPEGYEPPSFETVQSILEVLKRNRQPVIDRIWEVKKARRGEWEEVVRKIPRAYRKMLIAPDLPQLRDFMQRVVGLIQKNEPMPEVTPPSPHDRDVRAAAKEEARLHGLRIQIEDQQDRPIYSMGVDAQAIWGESWISVWPDPARMRDPAYKRGSEESAGEYKKRYQNLMADGGVPIVMDDHDPQTIFPFWRDRPRLGLVILESEHEAIDIELGYGYKPVTNEDGTREWVLTGHAIGEAYVTRDYRAGGGVSDPTHDRSPQSSGVSPIANSVKKHIYIDCWTYQMYLDGILVEEWEHGFGCVPMFPAYGEQTSDRDPAWASVGIADASLAVAKQVVMWTAILSSSGMMRGFPTPFLKNPESGLVDPLTGEAITRQVQIGEMNLMGLNEDIVFPYLQANTTGDFRATLDWLMAQLEQSTLSNFGKAVGTDIAGYAVAQIRSMQTSILSTIYTNARRQWRKIFYFLRHLIVTMFPFGLTLRGAIETDDEGNQYRPIMQYGKKDTTEFTISVHITEGIPQDEIAEGKAAIEKMQSGVWSRRRTMEKTGVEDPAQEADEIDTDRVLGSPAADEVVLQLAMQIASERHVATRQDLSSPFYQALEQAKQKQLGGPGQFANQGGLPENADEAGPLNQREGMDLRSFGVPAQPGGAAGVQQTPVGAPG